MSVYPSPQPHPPEQLPPQMVRVSLPAVKPGVTYALLGITIFIYLLQAASQLLFEFDLPAAFGLKANELIRAGQLWRLLTPMLLHGSLIHIAFNMYALYAFGTGLESRFGHGRFLLLYILGGFAGNVFSFLFSVKYSLGASTAIFGLLAAEGVFLYQNRELFGDRAIRALGNIITVGGINLILGLQPGIDNWGHVGGLLGGLLFAWFGGPRWKVEGIFPALHLADERAENGTLAGSLAVLLVFIPLAAVGMWFPLN